jgi:hypothetical protein
MGSGAELFARYAYPPNALGYCGPEDGAARLARRAAGRDPEEGGFAEVAGAFEGAWPYLELLAEVLGASDPLDAEVVEAYWIGGPALERVSPARFGPFLAQRFGAQVGVDWGLVRRLVAAGAVPHHSFHVLAIYPWLGLLRSGRAGQSGHATHAGKATQAGHAGGGGRPLEVLDRCRIRWGTVLSVEGSQAVLASAPLTWDGRALALGEPVEERVDALIEGVTTVPGLGPGDLVAAHWHWICDRLDAEGVERLREATERHLDLVNATGN